MNTILAHGSDADRSVNSGRQRRQCHGATWQSHPRRPLRPLRLALAVVLVAAAASADVLVLRDGSRLETRGAWSVEGRSVVFTTPAGVLSSLPLDEVDVEASRAASQDPAPAPPAPEPPPPRAPAEPVLVVTNQDVGPAVVDGGLRQTLEAVYEQYRHASVAGDLAAHRAVRDDEMLATMQTLTADDLRFGSSSLARLGELRFLGLDRRDRWARLRYFAGPVEPDAAGPRLRFVVVIFRSWGAAWKLVRYGGVNLSASEAGDPPSLAKATLPPQLRIDDEVP